MAKGLWVGLIGTVLLIAISAWAYAESGAADASVGTPAPGPFTGDGEAISIVVQDLEATGGVEPADVSTITEYLRGQIGGLPTYQVVEQSRIRELMEVNERQQLSGLFEMEGDPEQLRLVGADQVVLGSVGRLFERVVVSVRLVELVTGEIVFSYTSHAAEDDIFLRLDEIVERIREYGQLRYQRITVAEIVELADRKKYAEAQQRLEAYQRQQRRTGEPINRSAEFLAAQETINANLYDDFFKEARRARRRDDFVEARRLITRAIALQPSAEALEERDRIRLEQEEYRREAERQQRLIELRAEERERREEAGVYLSPFDAVKVHFETISTRPHRLSVSRTHRVPADLTVTSHTVADSLESWGFGYTKPFLLNPEDREPAMLEVFPMATAGITLDYREVGETNTLSIHPTLSPFTGLTVHLLNVVVSVGVDGGYLARYGEHPDKPTAWTGYPTVGAFGVTDVMIFKNLGVHVGVRGDYLVGFDTDRPLNGAVEDVGETTGTAEAPGATLPASQRTGPFLLRLFAGVSL